MNLHLDANLLAKRLASLFCLAILFPAPSTAFAIDLYDEGLSGDAPAGGSSINLGSLQVGSGRIVGGNLVFDTDDYFFTIAAGLQLDSIIVDSYSGLGSAAIQDPFLGAAVLSGPSAGSDFLDLASIARPVGPGSYLWRATTGTGGPTSYIFDFRVSMTPDPATLRYDEAVSGDAPAGGMSIDLGALPAGSNRIVGSNLDFDTDDFLFTIPQGFTLDAITIRRYTGLGSAAIQEPFVGASQLTGASAGSDFLDLAGTPQPVGPGTYLWRATTGTGGPTSYEFDFQVSVIPEPGTLASAVLAISTLGVWGSRRQVSLVA